MNKLTFVRANDGTLTADAAVKATAAARLKTTREPIPSEIWRAANVELAREAKKLAFSSGKSYDAAARHLVEIDGWLALGVAVYTESRGEQRALEQLGIVIGGAS